MIDLEDLRSRMEDHGVVGGMAVVVLTAREVYDIITLIEGLQSQLAAEQECCCSIDWDHRCPVHGPQEDDDNDEKENP